MALPHESRQRKSDPCARLCYFLNFGYNYWHERHQLLDTVTGKVVFSRDVTWYHPEAPLIPPATAVGNSPTAPPKNIYVPMSTPVPSVAAPAPAPVPPAHAPTPSSTPIPAPTPMPAPTMPSLPISMSNSPAPILPRVSHELAHEGYAEVPGRMRGEIRALRDASREYAHRYGLPLDHAALVSMLGNGEAVHRECTRTRRLSGPADRMCVRPSYSDEHFRGGGVTVCGNMAAIHEQRVPRSTAGRHFHAGIATSRERDRC